MEYLARKPFTEWTSAGKVPGIDPDFSGSITWGIVLLSSDTSENLRENYQV